MAVFERPVDAEDVKMTLESEEYVVKTMPAHLTTFDMTSTYIMIVFFITNASTAVGGGVAAFTYWAIGAITFFIPCVIATAQLGSMFPYDGSLYNWTHKAFGGYWSFFVAFCAWFPGVLVIISAGDVVVAYIQGLNSTWLVSPQQQGLVIIGLIILSGIIACQKYRMVQHMVNVVMVLTMIGVVFIGLAGIMWLMKGHQPVTSISNIATWNINWDPKNGNLYLFGTVALAYLGADAPLSMGGEIAARKSITRHLYLGTLLVIVGYFIATFTLLVIEGPVNGTSPFALVSAVDMSLGKMAGNITALCIMSFFVMAAVVYNYTYARLLLVGGIDKRLPVIVGRLNKWRVPGNAITFQTLVASIVTLCIFFLIPYIIPVGSPSDLTTEVYNVMLASSTLVWAISTLFLFVNLLFFLHLDSQAFRLQLIFPQPVIWACIILGSLSCIVAVIDSLFYSWIAQLIDNTHWWYIIGGLTLICLIFAAIGSMLASGEAAWQHLRK